MIDRVLTWRASSRDMLPLRMQTRPVTQAVDEAVRRFTEMIGPEEVDFSSTTDSRLKVRHDAKALNAVVLNLLINAYKYTGANKRIELSVRDEGNQVLIAVRDNGRGMGRAELKRVFQPFYRAEPTDGGQTGGVGLGLPIARYLIGRHEGGIDVQSEKGRGATFTISLPAVNE